MADEGRLALDESQSSGQQASDAMNANVSGQTASISAENHGLSNAQHPDIKCTVCQSNSHVARRCHLAAEPAKLLIGHLLEELIALPIPDRPHNLSPQAEPAYEIECLDVNVENAQRAADAGQTRLILFNKAIKTFEALARDVVAANVQMAQMSQARAEQRAKEKAERAEKWAKESAEWDVRAEKWAKERAEGAENRAEWTEERANKRAKNEADSTEQ